MKLTIKLNKTMFLAVLSLAIAGGFGFLGAEKAQAGFCGYVKCGGFGDTGTTVCNGDYASDVKDAATCTADCGPKYSYTGCPYFDDETKAKEWAKSAATQKVATTATEASNSDDLICRNVGFSPRTWFNCILLVVLRLLANLMEAIATLFKYVVEPANFISIAGNPIVYQIWTKVRDLLNVAFILTLLFSAFCTVFQIEKYNYKNILVTLIIMALLVNFSFPITRVIIDFSNVIMYYLLNALGVSTNTLFAKAADQTALGKILYQSNAGANTSYLLASVIFSFVFVVTILIVTILLLIRVIVLTILIIFSPIAFVGSIVPFLSSKASTWWTTLFNHCFFGPIMIFMIYIALEMMAKSTEYQGQMEKITQKNGVGDPTTIAAMAFFAIPIVILWVGLGTAQSMSVAGAGAVMGRANKFMGWSAKTLTGYRAAKFGIKKGAKMVDRDVLAKYGLSVKTFKDAWKQRQDDLDKKKYGKATGAWRDRINSVMSGGKYKTRFEEAAVQNHIAEKEKEYESAGTDFSYLYEQYKKARAGGKAEEMAALQRIITKTNEGNSFMISEAEAEGKPDTDEAFDPFKTTDRYVDQLMKAGMSEHMAVKQVNDMGLVSVGKGMTQLHGAGEMDIKTGEYKRRSTSDPKAREARVRAVQGKINETKAQTWADTFHWTSLFNQKKDGSVGNLHEMGISQLENLTGAQIQNMGRIRGDGAQRTFEGIDKIKALQVDIQARAQNAGNLAATATTKAEKDRLNSEANRLELARERLDNFIKNVDQMAHGEKV